ncbi:MAG TPA: CHRD domain-containing protein, partial [Bradyrhizobium sp.]|nr:CHRD domain-containing protein [Bradyrhizobium sp.]
MSTTISRRVLVLAASLIALAWTGPTRADPFKFPLTGEQCVPPVATSGTGEVQLTYDPETRLVT